MQHYTYYLILLLSLAGPLALSFDKKVRFFKKWKYVFAAMVIPAILYIAWDSWFTKMGVWRFNPEHITGPALFHLPLEEILFFFIVPYCCVFIYACIRSYFPDIKCTRSSDYLFGAIGLALFIAGIFYKEKIYTATTFIFTSLFIALILLFRKYFRDFNTNAFLLSFLIILVPFLVVNGFLTAIPVVIYNDMENLGIRIYTIPFEDIFYGMLLVMMNVAIYERLKNGEVQNVNSTKG